MRKSGHKLRQTSGGQTASRRKRPVSSLYPSLSTSHVRGRVSSSILLLLIKHRRPPSSSWPSSPGTSISEQIEISTSQPALVALSSPGRASSTSPGSWSKRRAPAEGSQCIRRSSCCSLRPSRSVCTICTLSPLNAPLLYFTLPRTLVIEGRGSCTWSVPLCRLIRTHNDRPATQSLATRPHNTSWPVDFASS